MSRLQRRENDKEYQEGKRTLQKKRGGKKVTNFMIKNVQFDKKKIGCFVDCMHCNHRISLSLERNTHFVPSQSGEAQYESLSYRFCRYSHVVAM